MRGLISHTLNQ
jgi:hypothetical protein